MQIGASSGSSANPHLAELKDDTVQVTFLHQLEVLDGCLRDAAMEVQAVGAQVLVPLGRLVAQQHHVSQPLMPLEAASVNHPVAV